MRPAVVSLLMVTAAAIAACRSAQQPSSSAPAPAPAQTAQAPGQGGPPGGPGGGPGGPGGPGGRPRPSPAAMDTLRRGMIARMLTAAAGHENDRAGDYYKNVKIWKNVPVRAFLDTMNSYGRSIGATCTGCHIANEWDKDDRKNKVITRQMQAMVDDLNTKVLPNVKELDEDRPPVTCAMCHAGSGHPKKDASLTPNAAPTR